MKFAEYVQLAAEKQKPIPIRGYSILGKEEKPECPIWEKRISYDKHRK